MKIYVLGSSGMLGNYVYKYFSASGYNTTGITREHLDASKLKYSELFGLGVVEGDVVINCIGVIKQRGATTDTEFLLVNSLFPRMAAQMCEVVGANFIHMTTDCVFDGSTGDYTESSSHSATDIYGKSKSLGEPEEATVVRTSIIGEEKVNKFSLVEWVKGKSGCTVNGFVNHFWNGVTCLQLAKVFEHIIKHKLFWQGTKHIYSPNKISKYELVSMLSDIYDLGITVNKYKAPEDCDRALSSERSSIALTLPSIYQQIEDMKAFSL